MNIDKVFTFGKYKGKSVDKIAIENPGYFLWAKKNVAFFHPDENLTLIAMVCRMGEKQKSMRRKVDGNDPDDNDFSCGGDSGFSAGEMGMSGAGDW